MFIVSLLSLIYKNNEKDQINDDERKQLITYAETDYSMVHKLLFKAGITVEAQKELLKFKDSDGYTALHRAAYSNKLDIVKLLVSFEKVSEFVDLHQLNAKTGDF